MRDSVGAPEVTLSEADLAAITAAAPSGATAEPRYNEAGMARLIYRGVAAMGTKRQPGRRQDTECDI
jgi:hypothetical protein